MVNDELNSYIDQSVLCWLATSNLQNEPNVSSNEMSTFLGDSHILLANMASPNSMRNIKENPQVCVSFVHVFIQKGFKIKGMAKTIEKHAIYFNDRLLHLTERFQVDYPVKSIIEIEIKEISKIIAPSYYLKPGIIEQEQIKSAMATYKVKPIE